MRNMIFQDQYDNKVYETTQNGTIISSFCPPGIDSKLVHDGTYLWKPDNQKETKNTVISLIDLVNNILSIINLAVKKISL